MNSREFGVYITVMTERDECLEQIAELERREALLTDIVRILDREKQVGGVSHHYGNLRTQFNRARAALDWLPPEPSFDQSANHGWPTEPVDAGAEEATDDDAEFGNCDECGEPLMFASMSTCARCSWGHEM